MMCFSFRAADIQTFQRDSVVDRWRRRSRRNSQGWMLPLHRPYGAVPGRSDNLELHSIPEIRNV